MYSNEGLGQFLFVLVGQTTMKLNARILAGSNSKCDYTLKLLNKRMPFSYEKNPKVFKQIAGATHRKES